MNRDKALAALLEYLRTTVEGCPHCVLWHGRTAGAAIYRRSPRGLTLRCKWCGLQWMVTYHQMAKAAAKWLEAAPHHPLRPMLEEAAAFLADREELRPERRGRRRRAAPPLEEAAG